MLRFTPTAQGYALEIDLVSMLAGLNGTAPAAPAAPVAPPAAPPVEPKAPPVEQRQEQSSSTTTTSRRQKRSRQEPKAAKPGGTGKEAYAAIRALRKEGRFAEAALLAEQRGWTQVVEQIAEQAARAAERDHEQDSASGRAKGSAQDVQDDDAASTQEEPKAPAQKPRGRPRCPEHRIFLKGDGTCSRCTAEGTSEPPAQEQPKAAPQEDQPAKGRGRAKGTRKSTRQPKAAPADFDLVPEGLSEADLILHWAGLASRAQEEGPDALALLVPMLETLADAEHAAMRQAFIEGQPRRVQNLHSRRVTNLRHILANLVAADAAA